MATAAHSKPRRKRIKDVGRAAKELGVNRNHLSRVIWQERTSPGLLKRYQEWQAQQKKQASAEAAVLSSLPTFRRAADFLESTLQPPTKTK